MKKIEVKIIISIMFFTIFIVVLQRYQLSENIIKQFKESKHDRNTLLLNTITPIVSLNIALGLDSAYNAYLDTIVLNNSDLDMVKLLDNNKKELYLYLRKDKKKLNHLSFNYLNKDIYDELTGEKLGTIELNFSNEDYKNIIDKSADITINIFLISFGLLGLFLLMIKREFRNLTNLTKNILEYDPKQNNFPLMKVDKKDEISLIHHAITSMVEKNNVYSKQLDDINANLEEKVKKRTQELEIQKAKAEELVNVKSNFLANMSHEIRTPMNAIIGITHLMQQTDLTEKQKKYLKKINKVSNNLLVIINDILDFSKLEAGKLKIEYIHFDMNDIMESLMYIFEDKAIEKGLKFSIERCCKYNICYGDSFRVEQVLINLISNAIKFTNEGSVSLSVECREKDFIRFSVKDSGIGIKKKQQKFLFDAFTQADDSTTREYGGTGLGLSISKQIIQQMHGKIWLESEVGKGSEFIFELKLPHTGVVGVSAKHGSYMDSLRDLHTGSLEFKKEKLEFDKEKIELLFSNLLEGSKKNLPKICEPIVEEIDKYNLSYEYKEKFNQIKILFKYYKFKEIVFVLEQS